MKIAQIANIVESVPPKTYGGTERVVYALTEGLVKRGHDVTLFASGDSKTSAKLVSVTAKSLRQNKKIKDLYGLNSDTLLHIGSAYELQKKFDIIHDHTLPLGLPTANISQTPVVLTSHGPINKDLTKLLSSFNNPYLVTISNSQLPKKINNLNYAGTVYNGLDMISYPFSAEDGGYLLFVGRISVEKGVHYAIRVAKKLNLPLIIAAKLDYAFDKDVEYFKKFIEPELNDKIRWIGEVDEKARNKLMSQALCFLHPVTWPEPFGLTLIEATACGCPVVAFNKGSIPEIIVNGINGYIVKTFEEMTKAVLKIENINRFVCRSYSLGNFSAERMVAGYEEVYRKIVDLHTKDFSNPRTIFDLAYAQDIRLNRKENES
jgi:glycosyltransferase involved in cell wall biosynthesis